MYVHRTGICVMERSRSWWKLSLSKRAREKFEIFIRWGSEFVKTNNSSSRQANFPNLSKRARIKTVVTSTQVTSFKVFRANPEIILQHFDLGCEPYWVKLEPMSAAGYPFLWPFPLPFNLDLTSNAFKNSALLYVPMCLPLNCMPFNRDLTSNAFKNSSLLFVPMCPHLIYLPFNRDISSNAFKNSS